MLIYLINDQSLLSRGILVLWYNDFIAEITLEVLTLCSVFMLHTKIEKSWRDQSDHPRFNRFILLLYTAGGTWNIVQSHLNSLVSITICILSFIYLHLQKYIFLRVALVSILSSNTDTSSMRGVVCRTISSNYIVNMPTVPRKLQTLLKCSCLPLSYSRFLSAFFMRSWSKRAFSLMQGGRSKCGHLVSLNIPCQCQISLDYKPHSHLKPH